ncbi:TPA: restriction endonuclease subunit S, partial [Escherichia coli]
VADTSYSYEKEVSNVIGILDDKINLNKKINQTLEQMSQTLFKSWFVDFDPVIDNALDAGNPIPEALQSRAELRQKVRNSADFKPLPAEIRSLFPSEFEETELGWVPKGWKIDNIGGLSDKIFSGGTPNTSTEEYWNGALNWFSSGETRNALIIETEKKITATGVKNSSTRLSVAGDILIASAGQGHTRGQTSLNTIDTYINQSVVCIRPIKPSYSTWLYFNLSSRYTEMRAISDSHSIRGSLTTKLISSMKVASPTDELISLFDINCSVFISKIKNNLELSRELKKLRDTLLPKLISGELSLEDLPDLTTDTEAA